MAGNPHFLLPIERPSDVDSVRSSITDSVSNFITSQLGERGWKKERQCCVCEAKRGMGLGRVRLYGCKFCAHAVCEDCSPTRRYHQHTMKEERVCTLCMESGELSIGRSEDQKMDYDRFREEQLLGNERFSMFREECLSLLLRDRLSKPPVTPQSTQTVLKHSEKCTSTEYKTSEKGVLMKPNSYSMCTQTEIPKYSDREMQCFNEYIRDIGLGDGDVTVINRDVQTECVTADIELQCECMDSMDGSNQTDPKIEGIDVTAQTELVVCLDTGIVTDSVELTVSPTCTEVIQTPLSPTNDSKHQQTDFHLTTNKSSQVEIARQHVDTQVPRMEPRDADVQTDKNHEEIGSRTCGIERIDGCGVDGIKEMVNTVDMQSQTVFNMTLVTCIRLTLPSISTIKPLHISPQPLLTISPTPSHPPDLTTCTLPSLHLLPTSPVLIISDPTIKKKTSMTSPFPLAQGCEQNTPLEEYRKEIIEAKMTEIAGIRRNMEVQTDVCAVDVEDAIQQMEEIAARNQVLEGQASIPKGDTKEEFDPTATFTSEIQQKLSVRYSDNEAMQALLSRLKSTEKELKRLRSPINGESSKSVQSAHVAKSCKCALF